MADAGDLKSPGLITVRVRVPPPAPKRTSIPIWEGRSFQRGKAWSDKHSKLIVFTVSLGAEYSDKLLAWAIIMIV
jgi:hypothetical protein